MNLKIDKERIRKIILIVIESCNLDCTYCYEHHKTNSKMTFDIARRCIDGEMKKFTRDNIIEIEFIGGEAFIAFDVIKQIVEYVDNKYSNFNIHYACTTNGTLVHGEVQEWLKSHKNFFCSLSLDGTKIMHDTNRPIKKSMHGSFELIDIEFFLNNYKEIRAKMTISPETLHCMAEGIKYIESLGFGCAATLATAIDWTNERNTNVLKQQLNVLVEHYIKNPEIELCQLLELELETVFAKKEGKTKYCGAGSRIHAYDVNGNQYPCQGFAPITLGKEAKKYIKCDFSDVILEDNSPCKECDFLYMCPDCYATNKVSTGDILLQSKEMCVFNRLCALASSVIQYHRIMLKGIENLSVEDQVTLKAINIIQKSAFDPDKKYLLNIQI